MPVYDDILAELKGIRSAMDRIAAHVVGEKTAYDLLPIWDCGHQHASRGEAIRCKAARQAEQAGGRGFIHGHSKAHTPQPDDGA